MLLILSYSLSASYATTPVCTSLTQLISTDQAKTVCRPLILARVRLCGALRERESRWRVAMVMIIIIISERAYLTANSARATLQTTTALKHETGTCVSQRVRFCPFRSTATQCEDASARTFGHFDEVTPEHKGKRMDTLNDNIQMSSAHNNNNLLGSRARSRTAKLLQSQFEYYHCFPLLTCC